MEAATPLFRVSLLAAALAGVIGCKSDAGVKARSQAPPLEPLAPLAPPPTPPTPAGGISPITPLTPGGAPAAVAGSPVAAEKGPPVVATGYAVGAKKLTPAELLKAGTPQVKVVAIVGRDNVITDQEVIESVWQQNDELAKLEGRAREVRKQELYAAALRKTIERELVLDEMYTKLKKADKLRVVDEIKELAVQATDKQIRTIKSKVGLKTDDELNDWLRLQGLTLPVFRRQFERQMMSQQYIGSMLREKGRRVGLAEIRDYYDKHPDEFKSPDRVKWQHIFVSAARHASPQAAQAHAEAIRQSAAGGTDFAGLSKQYDDGVAGKQGGFGAGESRGEIQPADVEPTVWALKPGQVSGLIPTPTGFHIVKVVEREYAGVLPFDPKTQGKIRDKLNDAFYEADMKKMIDELWRKGVVRILEE
jgi:parvulin-like peptidyl-prolyl isomerase